MYYQQNYKNLKKKRTYSKFVNKIKDRNKKIENDSKKWAKSSFFGYLFLFIQLQSVMLYQNFDRVIDPRANLLETSVSYAISNIILNIKIFMFCCCASVIACTSTA